jgi:hypothetical protein
MRDDWALIDFARAFMPNRLAQAMTLKVASIAILALMALVLVLKAIG